VRSVKVGVLVFTAVLIAILVCIASGIWVAIALVRAISEHRRVPASQLEADGKEVDEGT
jgi:hypothetical protein